MLVLRCQKQKPLRLERQITSAASLVQTEHQVGGETSPCIALEVPLVLHGGETSNYTSPGRETSTGGPLALAEGQRMCPKSLNKYDFSGNILYLSCIDV